MVLISTDYILTKKAQVAYLKPTVSVAADSHCWETVPEGKDFQARQARLTWHGAPTGTAGGFLASTGAERAAVKHAWVRAVPFPHGHSEWRALRCSDQEQRTAPYV